MQPRNAAREFAIILFCLLSIAAINDYAHNRFQSFSDYKGLLKRVFGVSWGYDEVSLYKLLDGYARDTTKFQGKKVEILGQILAELPADTSEGGEGKTEKVGENFRLFRRFSESGDQEGSHVISIPVHFAKAHDGLGPNMWVLVRGVVQAAPGAAGEAAAPMIEAEAVVEKETPEHVILTPTDETGSGNEGEEGDGHDHEH